MPRIYNPADKPNMSTSGPLDGAVICLSGNLSKPKAVIDVNILKLGGSVVSTVTQSCTHLISTPFEFEALTTKVMTAITKNIPVVSEEWISACEHEGDLADVEDYAIQSASAPVPVQKKKRAPPVTSYLDDGDDDDDFGSGSGSKPLRGITICCSGSLSQIRRTFHKFCSDRGAGIALSVTARTTHLVTTECEADNPTRKVLEAMNRQTPIVCEAFIHACIAAGKLVDDTPYFLIDHGTTSNNASSAADFSFSSSPTKKTNQPGGVSGGGGGGANPVISAKPIASTKMSSLSTSAQNAKKRNMIASARSSGSVVTITSNPPSEAAARQVMLAHKFEPKKLKDPTGWWISEKLDGVRAYWDGYHFYSRNGNQFPCPEWFKVGLPKGTPLDGELWCGRRQFRRCLSIVRNRSSGELWKFVTYLVFDAPSMKAIYEDRVHAIHQHVSKSEYSAAVGTIKCESQKHLTSELKEVQAKGGEGLMLRQPKSFYDLGKRSNTLLKVKTQHDEEAIVVGHEGGKGRNAYRLGALTLRTPDGREFSCGTGLSDSDRADPPAINSIVTFRYTELMDNGYPRFPVFVSPRDDIDWDDYCKTYSPPSKNSFVSGELEREHSIMYAPPKLHRSLSQKAESLNSPSPKKKQEGGGEEGEEGGENGAEEDAETEEFDSEDEALNMALIASAKEHAALLAAKHEDSDTDLEEGASTSTIVVPKKEEEDQDTQDYMDEDKDHTTTSSSSSSSSSSSNSVKIEVKSEEVGAAGAPKKRKHRISLLDSDTEEEDVSSTMATPITTAKKKITKAEALSDDDDLADDEDDDSFATKKSKISTPDAASALGLSPDEMRRLKRMEAGMCVSCGILEAGPGHDTCCRGCALGRGCSCSPPLAPVVTTTTGKMSKANDDDDENEFNDNLVDSVDQDSVVVLEEKDDSNNKKRAALARTRSQKLADETGLDIDSVRQMLSENDQAEGQMGNN